MIGSNHEALSHSINFDWFPNAGQGVKRYFPQALQGSSEDKLTFLKNAIDLVVTNIVKDLPQTDAGGLFNAMLEIAKRLHPKHERRLVEIVDRIEQGLGKLERQIEEYCQFNTQSPVKNAIRLKKFNSKLHALQKLANHFFSISCELRNKKLN